MQEKQKINPKSLESFDIEDPPFPLMITPSTLVTLGISKEREDESFIIHSLTLGDFVSCGLIGLLLRQRQFADKLQTLQDIITECVEYERYAHIQETLLPHVIKLREFHRALLDNLQNADSEPPTDFLSTVIDILIGDQSLLERHRAYYHSFLSIESLVIAFSQSEVASLKEGQTAIQIIKTPFKWRDIVHEFFSDVKQSLTEEQTQRLQSFIRTLDFLEDEFDSVSRLEYIQTLFLIEPFPITVQGRRFIKKGKAMKICRKEISPREIILFSDYFVYAQSKGGMLVVPGVYPLEKLRVDDSGREDTAFLSFYAPVKSFILQFESPEAKARWKEALESAITNSKEIAGESLEPYNEAPIWTPDDVTQKCMLCGQPHTFINRRHHCRKCGIIVCQKCSSNRLIVENISKTKKTRVCNQCFNLLQSTRTLPEES